MAITMTRRERLLLLFVLALAAVAVIYSFGLKGGIRAFAERRETLRQAKGEYEAHIDYLSKRGRKVEIEYKDLEQRYPMGEEFAKVVTSKIGNAFREIGMRADIDPYKVTAIENLQDYGYVTLPIRSSGDVQRIVRMLEFFDTQAILVEDLKLTGRVDSPQITVEVSISQIVKLSDEMKATLEKETGSRSDGRSRRREPVGL